MVAPLVEYIQEPVVVVDGQTYFGRGRCPMHYQAVEEAEADGKYVRDSDRKYLTSTGRIVDLQEAAHIAFVAGQTICESPRLFSDCFERVA